MVWRLGGLSNVWLFWERRYIYRSSWVWVSVYMPESGCAWTAFGLVRDNRRLGLRQGHGWPCTTWQGDSDLCNSCVWKQRRAASPRQRVGIDNYIVAWSLNLKQTLENANNQVGKHNSLKSWNENYSAPKRKKTKTFWLIKVDRTFGLSRNPLAKKNKITKHYIFKIFIMGYLTLHRWK